MPMQSTVVSNRQMKHMVHILGAKQMYVMATCTGRYKYESRQLKHKHNSRGDHLIVYSITAVGTEINMKHGHKAYNKQVQVALIPY